MVPLMVFSQPYKDWHPFASAYPDSLLKSSEAANVVRSVIKFQTPVGGWPKNIFFPKPSASDDKALSQRKLKGISEQNSVATIDNSATTFEIGFLMRYYKANRQSTVANTEALARQCRRSVMQGVEYLLCMQYSNGGFPQYWPRDDHYHAAITFNDNAMVNVLRLLRDFAALRGVFAPLASDSADQILPIMRQRAHEACEKGVRCILKCQLKDDEGKLAIWCQQHDPITMAPVQARAYELPSFCTSESVTILRFLRETLSEKSCPDSLAVRLSISSAESWFEKHQLNGMRKEFFHNSKRQRDYRIVPCLPDENCPPLWARFYDLKYGRPLFCGRDGIPRQRVEEIDHERRNGYSWFNTSFAAYRRAFPKE